MEATKIIGIIIFILLANLIGYKIMEKVLVVKTTQQVMERLSRDYVPGPYAPGFDPDKIDPRVKPESISLPK
jgi:hypothetical protein